MKKQLNILIILLSIFTLFSFFSCEIGLGEAIDLEAPVLKLTSHNASDFVSSNFTLQGEVSDNEVIARVLIDFEEADIHYKLEKTGNWMKKTSTNSEWQTLESSEASVVRNGKTWKWKVNVYASDAKEGTGSTYNFTIVANDEVGNASTTSKLDCSLVVDENVPTVSVNRPELHIDYSATETASNGYKLQDGNIISRLFNGTILLEGRQDSASSFKELRIEFDNGTTSESEISSSGNYDGEITTEDIANYFKFDSTKTYFAKTLEVGKNNITDLRTWALSIPQNEWATAENGLATGKHIIRVVSTSISNSNAWERKVLGYFVWWPEADTPWITIYSGATDLANIEESSVYPASKIYGLSQDDDGIKSVKYSFEKQTEGENFTSFSSGSLNLLEDNAKSSQWSLAVPAEIGNYKLTITTIDTYGVEVKETRYYKVLDVQPPTINLESPEEGSSALTANKKLLFKGSITDDGNVTSCKIVHLNPADGSPDNKIKYLNGSSETWNAADGLDENGNKIYTIKLGTPTENPETKTRTYSFTKEFDVFNDLQIGTENKLTQQDFIVQVKDNAGLTSVILVSLLGDTENPEFTIDSIRLYNSENGAKTNQLNFSTVPNLPVINLGDYVIIKGTWKDNSTTTWNDSSKINDISISWGNVSKTATKKADGTWEIKLTKEDVNSFASGNIVGSIVDYAENSTTVTKSVFVEKENAQLNRINSEAVDGSYKVGDEIIITLDFTKSVKHENGTPSLTLNTLNTLNTERTATYVEGSGTAKYKFKYIVQAGDNINQLLVKNVNNNNCIWKDAKTDTSFTLVTPTDENKTLKSRNIIIDTTAPTISSIKVNSQEGAYKEGASIYFKLEFSEDVVVTNPENLKLQFTHKNNGENVISNGSSNGGKTMLLSYDTKAGDNTNLLSVEKIIHENVIVKDAAGNELTEWSLTKSFENIAVDTTKPNTLVIIPNNFVDEEYVTSYEELSFELDNVESGINVEYSLNNGEIWNIYSGKVPLPNNGKYTIVARQTDKAGNVSDLSDSISLTIDKGNLINRVSATTPSGTYSTNTTINKISGFIEFRKAVTIEQGAKVTLNIENGNSKEEKVLLNECTTGPGTASKFTFDYTIQEGDSIQSTGDLDVKAFSFTKVILDGKEIPISISDVPTTGKFSTNRQIKLLTGNPSVTDVELTGEDSNAVLTVTFNRDITKGNGTITFTQSETGYRVPTVLSATEYNDLKATLGAEIDTYYEAAVNGATENGNYLTPDTKTKYVLKFSYDNNSPELKNLFREKKVHIVEIPIYASAVSVSGKTLTVKLTDSYALPVKGATYTVEISEGAVQDSVRNTNKYHSTEKTSNGIEKAEIRIEKKGYEIINAGDLLMSDVNMPETAQMKIACQTPDSSIRYGINQSSSTHVVINDCSYHDTETADVTIPTINNDYTGTITLGTSGLTFDTAKGMKFAIAAQASNSEGTTQSHVAYEYAARTVLKFDIGNRYKNADDQNIGEIDDNGNFLTSIKYNENKVHVEKLTIWIIGGDSDSGGNTIDPFPLSWGDPSNFKMMKLDGSKDKTTVRGEWYWITWDISAPTYHGFVAGDVPSDAQENGPSIWYAGECFYTPLKSYYILYPGETLYMTMKNGFNDSETNKWVGYDEAGRASYFFRWKNIGTR